MATMNQGTLISTTGQTLDKRIWLPQGAPRAIVQLVHGMAEHIDRYDAPARALCDAGYLVVGHTHLGHGPKAKVLGHFADEGGWDCLLEDIHRLRLETEQAYPGVPYFLLGHSMGSFLTRCYLTQHGEGLRGAVLSGTGWFGAVPVKSGIALRICCAPAERLISPQRSWIGWLSAAPTSPLHPTARPLTGCRGITIRWICI